MTVLIVYDSAAMAREEVRGSKRHSATNEIEVIRLTKLFFWEMPSNFAPKGRRGDAQRVSRVVAGR